jgi:hypothetical protein
MRIAILEWKMPKSTPMVLKDLEFRIEKNACAYDVLEC